MLIRSAGGVRMQSDQDFFEAESPCRRATGETRGQCIRTATSLRTRNRWSGVGSRLHLLGRRRTATLKWPGAEPWSPKRRTEVLTSSSRGSNRTGSGCVVRLGLRSTIRPVAVRIHPRSCLDSTGATDGFRLSVQQTLYGYGLAGDRHGGRGWLGKPVARAVRERDQRKHDGYFDEYADDGRQGCA